MPVREGHWVVMGIAYPFSIFYNNKGDSFYHSVYITSPLFDHFDFSNTGDDEQLDVDGNALYTKRVTLSGH